jgi:hypothetical protein
MATYTKFNSFVEAVHTGKHNLATGVIKVALCATASAPVATNTQLSNLTEISYTNLSARTVTTTSCVQTSGTLKFILADLVLTSSVGDVAAFQYVVLYNDSATNKELIGFYDYAAAITLHGAAGDTFTLDFDNVSGVFTAT